MSNISIHFYHLALSIFSKQVHNEYNFIYFKDEKSPLKVKELGLNIDQNAISHHTLEYDICQTTYTLSDECSLVPDETDRKLVVRRGQPFDLDLTFTREYKKETDDLRFVFEFGKKLLLLYCKALVTAVAEWLRRYPLN